MSPASPSNLNSQTKKISTSTPSGGPTEGQDHPICPNCYQIVHIAPSAIRFRLLSKDNLGDPELIPVGVFEMFGVRLERAYWSNRTRIKTDQ